MLGACLNELDLCYQFATSSTQSLICFLAEANVYIASHQVGRAQSKDVMAKDSRQK
jgi:hypothetical protein